MAETGERMPPAGVFEGVIIQIAPYGLWCCTVHGRALVLLAEIEPTPLYPLNREHELGQKIGVRLLRWVAVGSNWAATMHDAAVE